VTKREDGMVKSKKAASNKYQNRVMSKERSDTLGPLGTLISSTSSPSTRLDSMDHFSCIQHPVETHYENRDTEKSPPTEARDMPICSDTYHGKIDDDIKFIYR